MGRKKSYNSKNSKFQKQTHATKSINKKSDNVRILQSIKNTLPIIILSLVILASLKNVEAETILCNPSLENGTDYEGFSYNAIKDWLFDRTPFFVCRLFEIKNLCLSSVKEQGNQQKIDAMEHYFIGSF